MGPSLSELFVVVPLAIASVAVPVASLVLLFMTYRKVSSIEKRLGS